MKKIIRIESPILPFRQLCVVLLLSLAGAFAAQANLLVNGGFETPTFSVGSYQYLAGSQLDGWTYAGGGNGLVLFNNSYKPVDAGLYSVQLETVLSSISQSFATSIGGSYRVSFDLSAYSTASVLGVDVGGPSMQFGGVNTSYQNYFFDFTASSSMTTLTLTSIVPYPHIDNVAVDAIAGVPDSGPGWLGIAVLGCLCAAYQIKRKHSDSGSRA